MIRSIARLSSHGNYLQNVAKADAPKNLPTLLNLLELRGDEIVDPVEYRKGKNPFLVPLSRNPIDNSLLCYIRWPTQKDNFDLQLVRTNEVGIVLESLGTDLLCNRIALELDYNSSPNANKGIELINKDLQSSYKIGDFENYFKNGKYPVSTEEDRRSIALNTFILTKIGAFPDCFENMSNNFMKNKNHTSALITCEHAISTFYGWGHPMRFNAQQLGKNGQKAESGDGLRASLRLPIWTNSPTYDELEKVVIGAGFTSVKMLGDLHLFRSTDPRLEDIDTKNLNPIQVTLDQAAHHMDAIALGVVPGGWDGSKELIANKYKEGAYPEMYDFIMS